MEALPASQSFARYMARCKSLTLVTLILMAVPFFYKPWYVALAIAFGVFIGSCVIRIAAMSAVDQHDMKGAKEYSECR